MSCGRYSHTLLPAMVLSTVILMKSPKSVRQLKIRVNKQVNRWTSILEKSPRPTRTLTIALCIKLGRGKCRTCRVPTSAAIEMTFLISSPPEVDRATLHSDRHLPTSLVLRVVSDKKPKSTDSLHLDSCLLSLELYIVSGYRSTGVQMLVRSIS